MITSAPNRSSTVRAALSRSHASISSARDMRATIAKARPQTTQCQLEPAPSPLRAGTDVKHVSLHCYRYLGGTCEEVGYNTYRADA
jgi:hypothetical protein